MPEYDWTVSLTITKPRTWSVYDADRLTAALDGRCNDHRNATWLDIDVHIAADDRNKAEKGAVGHLKRAWRDIFTPPVGHVGVQSAYRLPRTGQSCARTADVGRLYRAALGLVDLDATTSIFQAPDPDDAAEVAQVTASVHAMSVEIAARLDALNDDAGLEAFADSWAAFVSDMDDTTRFKLLTYDMVMQRGLMEGLEAADTNPEFMDMVIRATDGLDEVVAELWRLHRDGTVEPDSEPDINEPSHMVQVAPSDVSKGPQ